MRPYVGIPGDSGGRCTTSTRSGDSATIQVLSTCSCMAAREPVGVLAFGPKCVWSWGTRLHTLEHTWEWNLLKKGNKYTGKEEVEEQSLESADWNYVFSQAGKRKSIIGVLILAKRKCFSRLEITALLSEGRLKTNMCWCCSWWTVPPAGLLEERQLAYLGENTIMCISTRHLSPQKLFTVSLWSCKPFAKYTGAVPVSSCKKGLIHRGAMQH